MGVKFITPSGENINVKSETTSNIIQWEFVIDCFYDYEVFRTKPDDQITEQELLSVANKVKQKIEGTGILTSIYLSPSHKIFLQKELSNLVQVKSCAQYDSVMNNIFNIADMSIGGNPFHRLLYINTVNKPKE